MSLLLMLILSFNLSDAQFRNNSTARSNRLDKKIDRIQKKQAKLANKQHRNEITNEINQMDRLIREHCENFPQRLQLAKSKILNELSNQMDIAIGHMVNSFRMAPNARSFFYTNKSEQAVNEDNFYYRWSKYVDEGFPKSPCYSNNCEDGLGNRVGRGLLDDPMDKMKDMIDFFAADIIFSHSAEKPRVVFDIIDGCSSLYQDIEKYKEALSNLDQNALSEIDLEAPAYLEARQYSNSSGPVFF